MKRGVIIVNAYSVLPTALNQAQRLKAEFKALGVSADIIKNGAFGLYIDGGDLVCEAKDYDFCVYLDKDKYASKMLTEAGIRLFNSHTAIRGCDDKMTTHILLSGRGVPMPKTVAGLLCYDKGAQVKAEFLDGVAKKLGYPLIVKESYGSLGSGVYKADDRKRLFELAEKLKLTPHLFQECITPSLGRDVRVIVIGGKVIAAMKRTSNGDFRSNLELGGRGEKFDCPADMAELCVKVAQILSLDYCGIDVLFGENGYYICEVNSNAFFGGIERVTGVNVAKAYAEYIYRQIYF